MKHSFEIGDEVLATVSIREGSAYRPRPDSAKFNGRRFLLRCDGLINDDETPVRPEYRGEFLMSFVDNVGWRHGWIASGDLTDFAITS